MVGRLLAGPWGTWIRSLLGFVLAAVLAVIESGGEIRDLGTITWWQATLAGALGALIPVIIAWLNSADTRYGIGSSDHPVATSI